MNSKIDSRDKRPACLLTALLWLAIFAGSASVGHAQELPSLVITAERPVYSDFSSSIRDEMRNRTQIAVWMTRFNARTDLGVKLGQHGKTYRVAAIDTNKRG